jgi:sulfonate transport system substrate-binding protein
MRFRTLALTAMVAVGFAATTAQAQQPVKIRIAWVVPVANSPTILYEIPSILKHKGKSYDIDLVRFQGTPPMITALQAGELDIALFAFSTFAGPARDRRRGAGRRRWLFHLALQRAEGQSDPESRGPQG